METKSAPAHRMGCSKSCKTKCAEVNSMKYNDRCGCGCSCEGRVRSNERRCCVDLISVILITLLAFTIGLILGAVLAAAILVALIPLIILAVVLLILLIIRLIMLWCCRNRYDDDCDCC